MKEEQNRFLALLDQLPARLTAEQTGWVLNCQPHDIPALVSSSLLKPLGNPPPNGLEFFCTAGVLELLKERSWLTNVTNTINSHWHRQCPQNKLLSKRGQNGRSRALDLTEADGER